jgi:hypothetical protein
MFDDEQDMMDWTCHAENLCYAPIYMDILGQEEQIRQIMKRSKGEWNGPRSVTAVLSLADTTSASADQQPSRPFLIDTGAD